eukprot:jgi/Ulvmu1/1858/UM012_0014.1
MIVAAVALLALAHPAAANNRKQLAADVVGLHSAYMEAQRAGKEPSDSGTFSSVWSWKQEAFLDVCPTLKKSMSASAKKALTDFPGYFEAGNTVIAPGPSSQAVTQMAMAGIFFDKTFGSSKPSFTGQASGCVTKSMSAKTASSLMFRQLMYAGRWLSAMIYNDGPPDSFKMVIGISDGGTYEDDRPTWLSPKRYQDKCYVADAKNPAGDVAAMAAAALALDAKYMKMKGSSSAASLFEKKAKAAYAYAKTMDSRDANKAACSRSSATTNCIGDCGDAALSSCDLYAFNSNIDRQLFAAAASLYWLTGSPGYRADADRIYPAGFQFWWQWGHPWPTGIIALAAAADPKKPPQNSKDYYNDQLRRMVERWTDCNNGRKTSYCEKTKDGRTYPIDLPWGNMGVSLGAMCAAGIYHKMGLDDRVRPQAACFLEEQLAYTTNHKCSRAGEACNTGTAAGYSYLIGYGAKYPTRVHSREVSFPFFEAKSTRDDNHVLCGGVVSGPYTDDGGSTDKYTNDRLKWFESEAALDYGGALACAFGGYAALSTADLSSCSSRTPFTGRSG